MIPKQSPRQWTLASALEVIGGLSEPSKMPWYGWSTPAEACITGSKLRESENSVCSQCYALKGNYMWPHVRKVLHKRLKALHHPDFVEAFIFALNAKYELQRRRPRENRFRWHDSGDLSSLYHLQAINSIALGTPRIRHWLPTREFGIVRQFKGPFATNLVVRMSFPFVGGKLTNSELPQSTVGRDSDRELHQCPAPKQDNKCLSCRACWTTADVNYHLH